MSIDVFPATVLNSTLWNGQTYEEGTFTVTATGFSGTAPNGTAHYTRIGRQVTVELPSLSSVNSNATTMTVTGLPVTLRPPRTQQFWAVVLDVSVYSFGELYLTSDGVITAYKTNFGAFSASGEKGINGAIPLTYTLASALAAPGWTGQSYEEGTFTVTATGFSGTAPSGTARYVRVGKQVTLAISSLSGTSNATTFTLTGLPAGLVPGQYSWHLAQCLDNGVNLASLLLMSVSSTTLTLYPTGATGPWTASGLKGANYVMLTYLLA